MEFGFTNDEADFKAVSDFVAAAIADGWSIEPTYQHEPVESAFRLRRDGFVLQGLNRRYEDGRKWKGEAKISGWCPNGIAIAVPRVYDFGALARGVRRCGECGAEDVETFRVGFAGRSCEACMAEARKKYEFPGWTN